MSIREYMNSCKRSLFQPVDAGSLIVFRILFGMIMVFYVLQYRTPEIIQSIYISSKQIFTYPLFEWLHLQPLNDAGFYLLYLVMALAALMICVGLFYRLSVFLFFLTFAYTFLLNKAYYNNHYYLILLIAFLLLFMHPHRGFSFDAKRKRPLNTQLVPFWNIFILRAQFCIVYFFGGITKINPDWINGQVFKILFSSSWHSPGIASKEWLVIFLSLFVLIIDLLLPILLIFRRTRIAGIYLGIFYHFTIKLFLDIGIFPFLSMAGLFLFLDPEQPRMILNNIRVNYGKSPVSGSAPETKDMKRHSGIIIGFICVYLLIQCAVPLRHWFYPGDVNWTQQGDRFSWRMFAHQNNGHVVFKVFDPDNNKMLEVPMLKDLTMGEYAKMKYTPDMIVQYAHYLREYYKRKGIRNPIIRADSFVSLNGRPFARLIDPKVNLANIQYPLFRQVNWLLPHPKKGGEISDIQGNNVAAFWPVEYQLIIIDHRRLLPGDDPRILDYRRLLDQLMMQCEGSRQQIGDSLVNVRGHLARKQGKMYDLFEMLEAANRLVARSKEKITAEKLELRLFQALK